MTRIRWTTRARYTALDPDGFVRAHRVAEWFQEAAVHASSAAGYPPARYAEIGASWMVRQLEIAVDEPVEYDEPVTIETWVSDLRRFRSHREYRALGASGRVVARGRAEWLLLELRDGRARPRLPDDEMRAAFAPGGDVVLETGLPLDRPDGAPGREMTRSVVATELDRHHHVNHTAYVGWIEDAGLSIAAARLLYEKDARLGDDLSVVSFVSATRGLVEVTRPSGRIMVAGVSVRRPS